MITYAFTKLKEKKYIIQGIIFFIIFLGLYFILDYLNYREAAKEFNTPSVTWVLVNAFLNIIMAFFSMLLMNLSTVMVEMKAVDRGSNFGFISIIFGIFTYSCTSCVVIFLSALSITFVPTAIFPFIGVWHGFLYKLLSLALIGVGFALVLHNIARGKCKVHLKKLQKQEINK